MVYLVEHGGACCGVRHIYGFDQSEQRDFDALVDRVDAMAGVNAGQNRMIEVILSDRQADKFPWLAAKGFRLVSRFRNANSGRYCNVFHRHTSFLPLDDGAAAQWEGARGSLGGNVDAQPVVTRDGWQRYRYTATGLTATGQTFEGRPLENARGMLEVRPGSWSGNCSWNNCSARNAELIVEAAPAPAAPTVVATLFQNVFTDGRRGGLYPIIGGAREAAPRCRRIDRVEFLSDGTNRVIENVQ